MPRKGDRWEGRYAVKKDTAGKTKYGYVYGKTYKDVREKLFQARVDFKKIASFYARMKTFCFLL